MNSLIFRNIGLAEVYRNQPAFAFDAVRNQGQVRASAINSASAGSHGCRSRSETCVR